METYYSKDKELNSILTLDEKPFSGYIYKFKYQGKEAGLVKKPDEKIELSDGKVLEFKNAGGGNAKVVLDGKELVKVSGVTAEQAKIFNALMPTSFLLFATVVTWLISDAGFRIPFNYQVIYFFVSFVTLMLITFGITKLTKVIDDVNKGMLLGSLVAWSAPFSIFYFQYYVYYFLNSGSGLKLSPLFILSSVFAILTEIAFIFGWKKYSTLKN